MVAGIVYAHSLSMIPVILSSWLCDIILVNLDDNVTFVSSWKR